MKSVKYSAILKEKQFMKLLIANVISRFGDSIDAIAYSWIMYEVTGNASLIALIMALNYLPTILLQPFLAVFVERMKKKNVIVVTNIGRGALVLLTMVLYINGTINTTYLMIATILTSTMESFCIPASISFLPKIIAMDKIVSAKAMMTSMEMIAQVIGMSLAGGIIAFFGNYFALLIDAITFLLASFIVFLIRYHEKRNTSELSFHQYKEDLLGGFRYLMSKKLLIAIIFVGMALNSVNIPFSSFQSIFVAEYLHLDAMALSVFGVLMMLGMFLGSSITPKVAEKIGMRLAIVYSGFILAPFYILAYFVSINISSFTNLQIYSVLGTSILVFGIGMGVINVAFGAVFIQNIDEEYQSRIGGITNALLTLMLPLVSLISSLLAVFLEVDMIFLIIGIIIIIMYSIIAKMKIYKQL